MLRKHCLLFFGKLFFKNVCSDINQKFAMCLSEYYVLSDSELFSNLAKFAILTEVG